MFTKDKQQHTGRADSQPIFARTWEEKLNIKCLHSLNSNKEILSEDYSYLITKCKKLPYERNNT